jgi:hypothetical protein
MPFFGRLSSLKIAISIQNLFLRGCLWLNRKVYRAEIFWVDTSFSFLSITQFLDLYLTRIKSYESPKLLKMLIFLCTWRFIKLERFSVRSRNFYCDYNLLRYRYVENFSFARPTVHEIWSHLHPPLGKCSLSGLFVWGSQKTDVSNYFETACVKIHKSLLSTTYHKLSKIWRSRLSTVGSGLYGLAHEIETLYILSLYFTLLFG